MSPKRHNPNLDGSTRDRLIRHGIESFAERGYEATSIRDLCRRASANLSAINYHFGSKSGFYQECFRRAWQMSDFSIPRVDPSSIRDACAWEAAIRRMATEIVNRLLAEDPMLHWRNQMMNRELVAPTEALGLVIDEFIRPQLAALESLLKMGIGAAVSPRALRIWSFGIVGQAMAYSVGGHIADAIFGQVRGNRRFMPMLSRHIAQTITSQLSFGGGRGRTRGRDTGGAGRP